MTRGPEEADDFDGMRSLSLRPVIAHRWLWLQCELQGRCDYGLWERKKGLSAVVFAIVAITHLSVEYSLQREAVVAVTIQKVLDGSCTAKHTKKKDSSNIGPYGKWLLQFLDASTVLDAIICMRGTAHSGNGFFLWINRQPATTAEVSWAPLHVCVHVSMYILVCKTWNSRLILVTIFLAWT
ncbi:hypothetical protein J3459_008500 [Metarhizium acridum]|nr:hypothetical protein J3459_008500 [Metarhizium acridum]